MAGSELLRCHVWTSRFLGTESKSREFLDLLETTDQGRWIPDKWGQFEPIRNEYTAEAYEQIVRKWTEERPAGSGAVSNSMLFRRRTPRLLMSARSSRQQVPDLNGVWAELEAKSFSATERVECFCKLILAVVQWSDAFYATARHTRQAHGRAVGGTPLLRLSQLDWLTFLGEPYLQMFGRERVLGAPFHTVREVDGGVLLLAAARPDSPEMIDSSELLLSLEDHLGPKAFAGHGYPEAPCQVPLLDLSDITLHPPPTVLM